MAERSIPVDLLNPGQVFACLGFVEAADILCGNARGGFDWTDMGDTRFRLAADGDPDPVFAVLRFLEEATVSTVAPKDSPNDTGKWGIDTRPDASGLFPFPDPSSPATLPARIEAQGRCLTVDHWGDATRRDNVKFWAGKGGYPGAGLLRDAIDLVRDRAADHASDPFALAGEQRSSLRFDWRRDYVPIDAGFSLNSHDGRLTTRGYPLVEIMAAVGLTHARPLRMPGTKLVYSYGVAGLAGGAPHDPVIARAALGARRPLFSGMSFRLFGMKLDWPGQENQDRCITEVIEENPTS